MSVSPEAIEAAAKGIWEARPMERVYEEGSPNYGAAKPWADIKQYQRDRCITLARYALEAAAPYIQATAMSGQDEADFRRSFEAHLDYFRNIRKEAMSKIVRGMNEDEPMTEQQAADIARLQSEVQQGRVTLAETLKEIRAEAFDEGFTACAYEHMTQQADPSHPITRTNPHRTTK